MSTYIHDGFVQEYEDENGRQYRLTIKHDEDGFSPRENDNVGTMVCFHRRYDLGDKHDYDSPEEFMMSLIRDNVPEQEVIEYAKSGNADILVKYDEEEQDFSVSSKGKNGWKYEFSTEEDRIFDDILDMFSFEDYQEMLSGKIAILPLYLYDHGGITMSTGGFSDPWDSGQVGWIYCTKETAEKELNTKEKTWEQAANDCLNSEVTEYDHYIMGNVYGFTLETLIDVASDEWEETDACWGFIGDTLEYTGIAEYLPDGLTEV